MATPVIILGGIYGGIFTPVEASVVAVFYALFVATVINRNLGWAKFVEAVKLTNITTATTTAVVGVSLLFGRFLSLYQVPTKVTLMMTALSTDPFIVLMMIVIVLFFLGMFMETLSTIVILTPVLLPLVKQLGVDPVHFGIIFVLTSEVGFLSPPLGVNLFVAMKLSGLSLERVTRGAFPFLLVIVACTILMVRFPEIPLLLPRIFMGYGGS
jgi:TRAP-type C4-dicarboxylate transport system, large permease component